MPKPPLYQLEIAPLTIVSIRRSPFFSYGSLTPVITGSLVDIPFGKRSLQGVVFQCRPLSGRLPTWMKMIQSVRRAGFLTQDQCTLALFLSTTYLTPLGNCLKHFLVPDIKKRTMEGKSVVEERKLPELQAQGTKFLKTLLKKTKHPKLFSITGTEVRKRVLIHYLEEKLKDEGVVLFLVPEFLLALWWAEELQPFFGESLALIHSKQKGSELSKLWEDIRTGKKRLIVGTRQALFAPFPSLKSIVVTDEEDMTSYKQWEMSPRYSVHEVAQELAQLKKSDLLLVTPTPGTRSLLEVERKKMKLIQSKKTNPRRTRIEFINLRFEKKKTRSLSQTLLDEINTTLRRKKRVLLLGKQGGLSPLSLCAKCRTVVRCPQCENVLTSLRAGHFQCRHCGYKSSVFPACRHCGSMTFKSFGAGTEKIEKEVHMYFPSAKILRLDRTSLEKRAGLEESVKSLRTGAFDVLIGTYSAVKVPNLPGLSLVAMIEADSHLAFPDYQAEEKVVRDVERSRLLLEGVPQGKVLLQTFEPELLLFREGLQKPYFEAIESLLEARKILGYPPEMRFLKVECPASTPSLSQKRALALTKELTIFIQKEEIQASLIPPHLPLALSKQKHYQFFIRFPSVFPFPPLLHQWCEKKASDCLFDLDPMTLN